ncbi:MAG: aldehyde dehydrogenase, partial [Microbacterium sp.]|nr:aldehyde dehydrogenase [Microbacterium sp.]
MTPTSQTRPAAPATEEQRGAVDAAVGALRSGARSWTHLTLEQRARLFERVRDTVVETADEWVAVASTSKGLDAAHPLRGEEWLSGPYAVLGAIDGYVASLRALAKGASPLDGVRTDAAPGGRLRARVFPAAPLDRLLLSGFTGEVWFRPGTTLPAARADAGLGQRHPTR